MLILNIWKCLIFLFKGLKLIKQWRNISTSSIFHLDSFLGMEKIDLLPPKRATLLFHTQFLDNSAIQYGLHPITLRNTTSIIEDWK